MSDWTAHHFFVCCVCGHSDTEEYLVTVDRLDLNMDFKKKRKKKKIWTKIWRDSAKLREWEISWNVSSEVQFIIYNWTIFNRQDQRSLFVK